MKGIDLSHWNQVNDWDAIRKAGFEFCFIKATEGTYFLDNTYKARKDKVRKAGMLLGAYHFAGATDPVKEADWFLENVGDLQSGEIVILDYETHKLADPASWSLKWLTRVEEKLGFKPISIALWFHPLAALLLQDDVFLAGIGLGSNLS